MNRVAVIDYGMGNLHSVAKALEHVSDNVEVIVTAEADKILQADRVVLPGVGAIRDCMAEIRRLGLDEVAHKVAEAGQPLLGVCVGLQAMMDFSEENGGIECLGLFAGRVEYFGDDLCDAESGEKLKIPHMGWNQVHQDGAHPLWQGIDQDARFYFVHSYFVHPADANLSRASCEYGRHFSVAVAKDNVFAVQFHPEKSQHDGLQLYKNFLNWNP